MEPWIQETNKVVTIHLQSARYMMLISTISDSKTNADDAVNLLRHLDVVGALVWCPRLLILHLRIEPRPMGSLRTLGGKDRVVARWKYLQRPPRWRKRFARCYMTIHHLTKGDKKNANKKKQKSEPPSPAKSLPAKEEEMTVPVTSIDDVVLERKPEESEIGIKNPGVSRSRSRMSSKSTNLDDLMRIQQTSGEQEASQQQLFQPNQQLNATQQHVTTSQRPSFNRTTPETSKANLQRAESFGAHDAHSKPVDDSGYREQSSINNMPDELRQKKGYLSSIKKRLTFSRPPKNTDTDTFLNELSAQFDEAMNLIDDIELSEEDEKIKYGEKWSYVPKNELETTRQEAPVEPAQETVSLTEPPSPVEPVSIPVDRERGNVDRER
uniref:Uncharacterized protein n=1 Tax=Ciona savignyi TaxID=51511 RepID=H2Y8Z3_CIOSA